MELAIVVLGVVLFAVAVSFTSIILLLSKAFVFHIHSVFFFK